MWSAFDNHYWPALYFVDREGVIRDKHFGEGSYARSESLVQMLLGIRREPVSVGRPRRGGGGRLGEPAHAGDLPRQWARRGPRRRAGERLGLNQWTLAGEWAVGHEKVVAREAGASVAFRFHARDAHLVLNSGRAEACSVPCIVDGEAPGASHGEDVDEDGNGVLREGRLYQLVREQEQVRDRTLEVTFLEPGAEAYSFTFGLGRSPPMT